MRIVTGEARGRKLAVPRGREVRPTSDRVREALFSSLGDFVRGARVLDLFAGTGALGLEALSRGASFAIFAERSSRVERILRANVEATGMAGRARIVPLDAMAALAMLARGNESFDLVFLDPPYGSTLLEESLAALDASRLLADGALVVGEHPRAEILPSFPRLRVVRTRSYGDTGLTTLIAPGATGAPRGET